uniref:Putative transposase-like protein n=1 Tax=Noccaea caerulescens TaxID=107243 RepID=A0A1J3H1B2_NOCCA
MSYMEFQENESPGQSSNIRRRSRVPASATQPPQIATSHTPSVSATATQQPPPIATSHNSPNSQNPASQASASNSTPRTQLTIEEVLVQPGRGNIRKLHPEKLDGATWFRARRNRTSKAITKMIQTQLPKAYETYSDMPQHLRDSWFRSFTQFYNWSPELTPLVRSEFDAQAAKLFSDQVYAWKQKYLQGKKPKNMNMDVFNGLIPHWNKPETKAISETNSKNRRSGNVMSTHNAGAKTIEAREEEMTIEAGGVPPDYIQLIEDIHTNKKTKQIQDPKAREFVETVKNIVDEMGTQRTQEGCGPLTREDINQVVIEHVPVNKNRTYALGKLVDRNPTSSSLPHHSSLVEEVKMLKEQHLEKDARLDSLQSKVDTLTNILMENFPSSFPPTQQ